MKRIFFKMIASIIVQIFILTNNFSYALAPSAKLDEIPGALIHRYMGRCTSLVNAAFSGEQQRIQGEIDRLRLEPLAAETRRISFPDCYFQEANKPGRSIIGTEQKMWDDNTLARGCSGLRSTSEEYPGIYQAGKAFGSLASGTDEYAFGYSHLYSRIGTKSMLEISQKFTQLYDLAGEHPSGMPVSSGRAAISAAILFNLSENAFVLVDERADRPDTLSEKIISCDFKDLPAVELLLSERLAQKEEIPEKVFLDLAKTPLNAEELTNFFQVIQEFDIKEVVLANITPQGYKWLKSQALINKPVRLVLTNVDKQGNLPVGNQWGWFSLFNTNKEFLPALSYIKDYGANMSSMLAEHVVKNVLDPLCEELDHLPDGIFFPKTVEKSVPSDPRQEIVGFFTRLEGSEYGAVTSSGMAAVYAAIRQSLPEEGGKVLYGAPAYGCTMDLCSDKLEKHNIQTIQIRLDDNLMDVEQHLAAFKRAVVEQRPDVVFFEPVVNPTCEMHDVIEVIKFCYSQRVKRVILDNTFLTGKCFSTLKSGLLTAAEKRIVTIVYSGTKHTDGGRSGDTWGYVSAQSEVEETQLRLLIERLGVEMAVMPAETVVRKSLLTYDQRTDLQLSNAEKFAEFLQSLTVGENPVVSKVYYPGIGENNKRIARKMQLNSNGTMLSFDFNDKVFTKEDVALFLDMLALQSFFKLAVSLGKDYTLFENSYYQVHAFRSHEEKMRLGITPHCIRVSVGCENIEDIIREFTLLLVELKNNEHRPRLEKWVQHYKNLYDREYGFKEINSAVMTSKVGEAAA